MRKLKRKSTGSRNLKSSLIELLIECIGGLSLVSKGLKFSNNQKNSLNNFMYTRVLEQQEFKVKLVSLILNKESPLKECLTWLCLITKLSNTKLRIKLQEFTIYN